MKAISVPRVISPRTTARPPASQAMKTPDPATKFIEHRLCASHVAGIASNKTEELSFLRRSDGPTDRALDERRTFIPDLGRKRDLDLGTRLTVVLRCRVRSVVMDRESSGSCMGSLGHSPRNI